jgi:hypothetical protein
MAKLRLLIAACVVIIAGVAASSASAWAGGTTCSGGIVAAGTYSSLTVTGTCWFAPGEIDVQGNLIVTAGAALNDHAAAGSDTTVHVGGSVFVGKGAVIGLGDYNPADNSAVVDGSVIATQAATLYLGGMTIGHDLISIGGGDPGRNFPIKDDTIGGNLIMFGWSGLWFGIIRDQVGGSVFLVANHASDPTVDPGSDSSEVATNTIGGSLVCAANVPGAQLGDTGGTTNTVGGFKLGQCAGL